MAAKIAMMAITINNSISVKPEFEFFMCTPSLYLDMMRAAGASKIQAPAVFRIDSF